MSIADVITKLRLLEAALGKSGKEETARFFADLVQQLSDNKESHVSSEQVLTEIVSCGAIAQYAGFDFEQTRYLEEIISLSEDELGRA